MAIDYYKLLIDEAPDALIVLSTDGHVLQWNRGAEHTFGYSSIEAIGSSIFDLVVPPDQIEEEREIQRVACLKDIAVYESFRRRKDGSLAYVNITTKAVRDANGRIECLVVNKKDVTALKVQRDVELVEARFRDLLESTPDAIVIVNITGRIVLVKPQAANAVRLRRAPSSSASWSRCLLPDRYRGGTSDIAPTFSRCRVHGPWARARALWPAQGRPEFPGRDQPEPARDRRKSRSS